MLRGRIYHRHSRCNERDEAHILMEMPMSATVLRPVRFARPRLAVRRLIAFLGELDARRRARARLAALDDHLLRDIGVSRADVAAELRRPLA
jgi:uncharacterized protein YjiS (DUF1127 family)